MSRTMTVWDEQPMGAGVSNPWEDACLALCKFPESIEDAATAAKLLLLVLLLYHRTQRSLLSIPG